MIGISDEFEDPAEDGGRKVFAKRAAGAGRHAPWAMAEGKRGKGTRAIDHLAPLNRDETEASPLPVFPVKT